MNAIAIFLAVIAGVFTMKFLFQPIFGDRNEFWRCVRFFFTPNIISLFRGQYGEDAWAELKLVCWLIPGGLAGFVTYSALMEVFG